MKEKVCTKCKEIKTIEDFYKDKRNKDNLRHWCKICTNINSHTWRKVNKNKVALYDRKVNYGHCTNYDEIMQRYNVVDTCECCGDSFNESNNKKKCIDHSGNIIRGIICNACNTGIGKLGDNIIGVMLAAKYLERT